MAKNQSQVATNLVRNSREQPGARGDRGEAVPVFQVYKRSNQRWNLQ